MGVQGFRNPVILEEREIEIHLPKGLIWKVGQEAKSKLMRVSTPQLNFDNSGKMPLHPSSSTRVHYYWTNIPARPFG